MTSDEFDSIFSKYFPEYMSDVREVRDSYMEMDLETGASPELAADLASVSPVMMEVFNWRILSPALESSPFDRDVIRTCGQFLEELLATGDESARRSVLDWASDVLLDEWDALGDLIGPVTEEIMRRGDLLPPT